MTSSGVHLLSWRWSEFNGVVLTLAAMLVAGMLKLFFTRKLHVLPEMCALILTGIVFGNMVHFFGDVSHVPRFTPQLFFHVLLPPIIVDASFTLYNRHFLANVGSVLLYSVVGTLFNAFGITFALYFLGKVGLLGGLEISLVNLFIFGALISAVDPVAVLTIFEELGVHSGLYFIVFGESLLNDGASVVLYNTMVALLPMEPDIPFSQFALAALSFFVVTLGGLTIGLVGGLLSSLLLRFTDQVRDTQPFFVFGSAYLSYFLAETVHWSGIIAVLGCGIAQKRYGFLNISQKSYTTVKYGARTMSAIADVLTFIFLGVATTTHELNFHWIFILWVMILITVLRFVSVFVLSAIINCTRTTPISLKDQFMMAYGGLRGAVSFSLANILSDDNDMKSVFIATTLFVVLFTVFVQGSTIKLLVKKLSVARKGTEKKSIAAMVNEKTLDHVMAGVESTIGKPTGLRLFHVFVQIEEHFIKPLLLRKNVKDRLTLTTNKLNLEDHYARLYGPTILAHKRYKDEPQPTEDNATGTEMEVLHRRAFNRAVSMNNHAQRDQIDHHLEMNIASNNYVDDLLSKVGSALHSDERERIREHYLSAKQEFKH